MSRKRTAAQPMASEGTNIVTTRGKIHFMECLAHGCLTCNGFQNLQMDSNCSTLLSIISLTCITFITDMHQMLQQYVKTMSILHMYVTAVDVTQKTLTLTAPSGCVLASVLLL